jgi:hypothetical protein
MRTASLLALPVTIAAVTAAMLTPPAATAQTPSCSPPGALRTNDLERERRADGTSEVTEYLARGEYRVTRCDKAGDLVVSQTVSPIRTPEGNVALVPTEIQQPEVTVSVLYGDPDDPVWAADFRDSRAPLRAATIAPTEPIEETPVAIIPSETDAAAGPSDARPLGGLFAQAAVSSDACTNPQFRTLGGTFKTRKYNYYINRKRFNFNATTTGQIVRGHTNWDATRNSCGLGDTTNLKSQYLGGTSAVVHPDVPDGKSVTDKGSMADITGCTIAIACTFNFPGDNDTVAETDQRFNSRYAYSNDGAAGKYDVQSIATHESGHSIGLDHADSSSQLTMFFQTLTGTKYLRSLAKGDVRGLRARYP